MSEKEQDWRLQGQERYLLGATLKFGTWLSNNSTNDHGKFCSTKIHKLSGYNVLVQPSSNVKLDAQR